MALAVCTKVGFRPEIALARLSLAELLLEEADEVNAATLRRKANEHLDFAIAEFRAMSPEATRLGEKMGPSLERALRHKGLLKA